MATNRVILIAWLALLLPASAGADELRDQTLEILGSIPSAASPGLEAWVNDGDLREIELGAPVTFHFRSDTDAYLMAIYLDSHGVATVLFPTADAGAIRLGGPDPVSFPPDGAGFELTAQLPLGDETIYALATPEPLSLERLGVLAPAGELAVIDASDAPGLARRIRELTATLPAGTVVTSRVDQRVVSQRSSSGTQYTTRGIVRYFSERHRSIRRPRLDLNIKFDFGSADLTESARQDLDVVGAALVDPQLASRRFIMAGHTDDVGDDAFNVDLSRRRADASRGYLLEKFGVEPDRLETVGLGESQPLVSGDDENARAQNRRVVLEMIR